MDATSLKTRTTAGFTLVELPAVSRRKREAFTLVELLVVITIIGILAALITVAAVGALKTMRKTAIRVEINEMDTGFSEYKNKTTAYPPNCQTDGTGTGNPLNETTVLNNLKRHMKQAFPRHQESDSLLQALAGITPADNTYRKLEGGLSAGEAIVFWLGGFSSDPKYPISGEGGPSYRIDNLPSGVTPRTADPVESRTWIYPFEVTRLQPRATDGYFDDSTTAGQRFVEYTSPRNDKRRINFWQYTPRNLSQPYLYFDVSRHPAGDGVSPMFKATYDPPASTWGSNPNPVYAIKRKSESTSATCPVEFANAGKFQILHCGLDDAWGDFSTMTFRPVGPTLNLLFPAGPFVGDIADTAANFTPQNTIEDAQP